MPFTAILAAGLLLAQAAASALPAEPASAPASAATPAKPKKPKMICTDETPVGSVISKRVCRTPEQAEADRETAKRASDRLMDRIAACSGATC